MKKNELEQTWKHLCSTASPCIDLPIYEDIPLPMVMVQGWFYDQCECFELLRQELTDEEQNQLFTSKKHLKSVIAKSKPLWEKIKNKASRVKGLHRHQGILRYEYFCFWIEQVYMIQYEAGGLETMVRNLGTVEAAHDKFKEFYKTNPVRILNAADTARLLARCDYLEPEKRPLLTSGALWGAAILLGGECPENNTDAIEREYRQEYKLVELEKEAASYIDATEELACFGKWKMEIGESIFCKLQKQPGVTTRSRRRKGNGHF